MSVIYQDQSGYYYVVTNKSGCWGWQDIDPDTQQYYPFEFHILSNAELIYDTLYDYGWSHLAICAALGNMIAESRMNPAQTQDGTRIGGSGGYGLCQWTPSRKYTNWARQENHDIYLAGYQLEFLNDTGSADWIINPDYSYNITWNEFINYTGPNDSEWLAMAFFRNYERGAYLPTYRQTSASWYDQYFNGYTPKPPPPPDPSPYRWRKEGMPLWMVLRKRQYYMEGG